MSVCWYVLRSKPRKESALKRFAQLNGHEIFYPTIPVKPVNPRASKICPYFPGYLFVHTDLSLVGESTFQWMTFSHGLVRIGGETAPVADMIVKAIRTRMAEIWKVGSLVSDGLKKGDQIVLTDGAFEGYEGLFDERLSGHDRVRVLLKMIHDRYMPVEVEADLLEKVK